MRTFFSILPLVAACACSGTSTTDTSATNTDTTDSSPTEPTNTQPQGACGDLLYHDVELVGVAQLEDGSPAVGASIRLEERNYEPQVQVWGEGTVTDEDGNFTFLAEDIIEVERCWGRIVDYAIVGELGELTAEDNNINSVLRNAVTYGTTADLSFFPLVFVE